MNIVFRIKEKSLDDIKSIIKKIGEIYDNLDDGSVTVEVEIK